MAAAHRIELLGLHRSASPLEAAAAIAALEQFVRQTSEMAADPTHATDPWRQAALLEGVRRAPSPEESDSWINA